ncbi:hypothetical protein HK101_004619 [Irineochytrium annulatum]|nr:hypothetical protein HK101_004619 [Irineochytrium annulatum]
MPPADVNAVPVGVEKAPALAGPGHPTTTGNAARPAAASGHSTAHSTAATASSKSAGGDPVTATTPSGDPIGTGLPDSTATNLSLSNPLYAGLLASALIVIAAAAVIVLIRKYRRRDPSRSPLAKRSASGQRLSQAAGGNGSTRASRTSMSRASFMTSTDENSIGGGSAAGASPAPQSVGVLSSLSGIVAGGVERVERAVCAAASSREASRGARAAELASRLRDADVTGSMILHPPAPAPFLGDDILFFGGSDGARTPRLGSGSRPASIASFRDPALQGGLGLVDGAGALWPSGQDTTDEPSAMEPTDLETLKRISMILAPTLRSPRLRQSWSSQSLTYLPSAPSSLTLNGAVGFRAPEYRHSLSMTAPNSPTLGGSYAAHHVHAPQAPNVMRRSSASSSSPALYFAPTHQPITTSSSASTLIPTTNPPMSWQSSTGSTNSQTTSSPRLRPLSSPPEASKTLPPNLPAMALPPVPELPAALAPSAASGGSTVGESEGRDSRFSSATTDVGSSTSSPEPMMAEGLGDEGTGASGDEQQGAEGKAAGGTGWAAWDAYYGGEVSGEARTSAV